MKYRLDEVFELQMGKTPSRSNRDYWEPGKHKWLAISDFSNNRKYTSLTKEKISDLAVAESGINIIPANTVVMSFKLSIGKVAITSEPIYSNEAIMAFIDKGVCGIIPEYIYYYLKGLDWNRFGNKAVMGLTLNKKTLSSIEIDIPSVDEQRIIVEKLSRIESLFDGLNKQLGLLDKLIKSRFVEMFGEPIANQKRWEIKRLKDLSLLITNGNTPKGGNSNYVDSGILFLRSQNVWRNKLELDDVAFIPEAIHEQLKKSSVHHNDILITKTGRINTENSSLGRAALYTGDDNSANINGHVYLVRLDNTVLPEFVVTILTGEAYRRYIRKVCVGGIDKRQINLDQVEDFPIIVPPIHLQSKFVEYKCQIDKSKSVIQKTLDETQLLFDSLMQEYFG